MTRTHPHCRTTAAAAAALLAATLGGCGGDISWCYASDDGRVSAGFNSSCRGGQAEYPRKDDVPEEPQGLSTQPTPDSTTNHT